MKPEIGILIELIVISAIPLGGRYYVLKSEDLSRTVVRALDFTGEHGFPSADTSVGPDIGERPINPPYDALETIRQLLEHDCIFSVLFVFVV